MIKQLIDMPFLKLKKIEYSDNTIRIYATIKSRRSKCPICGKYSNRVHDYYIRTISDLPVFQNRTVIHLKTRKFKCGNARCDRRVFSEQTPAILRYSRRTNRASRILDSFAIELTGRLGSIMSKKLSIPVSSSTITRIAHSQALSEIKQPKVLGVDDWAYRKGVSYGTILIDMETSKPIDLLPSRDGQVLKDWLLKYNDVKIITRDRASSYAAAVNEACPDAIQIADRFHILMNLSDALDAYFKSIRRRINSLITAKTNEFLELPAKETLAINEKEEDDQPDLTVQETIAAKVDPRMDTFLKVKELQSKGTPIKRIATDLIMSRNTVKSYFNQEILSPRKSSTSTNIEVFTDLIVARLNENGYKLIDIFREIKELEYNGGRTQGCVNIKLIKENCKIETKGYSDTPRPKIQFVKPLSSRKLAKYIGCSLTEIIDHHERFYLQTLLDNITELRIVRKLVQIFKTMLVRGRGNIKRWIDFIIRSKYKLSGLKAFARGMLRDIEAVENGINMSWSNGAVEGHVNRIKSIKRQMYGRASFELLRKKVILSQSG
ncbi:ISL3 family transposase [Bacteroidota bacterium]